MSRYQCAVQASVNTTHFGRKPDHARSSEIQIYIIQFQIGFFPREHNLGTEACPNAKQTKRQVQQAEAVNTFR
jgi:hypothetical protein